MPMRIAVRSIDAVSGDGLGAAEGGFANHFSSVWVRILGHLQILFHDCISLTSSSSPFGNDDPLATSRMEIVVALEVATRPS
jgi:hypothetical protein